MLTVLISDYLTWNLRRLWKCTTSTNHRGAIGKEFSTDGTGSINPGDRRKVRCGEQNLLWKLAMDRSPVWHANEKHTDEGQSPCRRAETQKRKQKRLQCHANKIEIKKSTYVCLFFSLSIKNLRFWPKFLMQEGKLEEMKHRNRTKTCYHESLNRKKTERKIAKKQELSKNWHCVVDLDLLEWFCFISKVWVTSTFQKHCYF